MSWRGGGSVGDGGVDEEIDKLFTRLAEHAEAGAHKKALKACDDILKVSPGDPDAIAAKAVALLELTRYDAAVDCIVNAPEDVRSGLTFEHAYTLYRSNDVDGALRVLEASGEAAGGELRLLQLRAQLLYRGGRAAESAAIYEELFKVRPECSTIFRRGGSSRGCLRRASIDRPGVDVIRARGRPCLRGTPAPPSSSALDPRNTPTGARSESDGKNAFARPMFPFPSQSTSANLLVFPVISASSHSRLRPLAVAPRRGR